MKKLYQNFAVMVAINQLKRVCQKHGSRYQESDELAAGRGIAMKKKLA